MIDAEGYDYEIIKGIDFERHRPRLLVYESIHFSAEQQEECRGYLEGLGYETMDQEFDTWCHDPRADDHLARRWRKVRRATGGGSVRRLLQRVRNKASGRLARAMAVMVALLVAAVAGSPASADAAPTASEVSFSTPGLFPAYSPEVHDYVVRCLDGPVTVNVTTTGPWRVAIRNGPFRGGEFSQEVTLSSGRAFTLAAKRVDRSTVFRYYVRCLPDDFPQYTFTRHGKASLRFFSIENVQSGFARRYAMIFDNNGVPIWWYKAPTHDVKVRRSGNVILYRYDTFPVRWEIHRLDGTLVRTLNTVGYPANDHDIQILGNGNYLVGAYVSQEHVDTSAYGGSSDATVRNAELQEVSSDGQLVWNWKSEEHISLSETGRWWPFAISHAYDLVHWNSIEPAGGSVIASFRNVDAIYKIDKSTGGIVWKLGGTPTAKSLTVLNYPHSPTLGGQHDVRLLDDGTLTVFDNRSELAGELENHTPAGLRFRIDEENMTATLLQSITDPKVKRSSCCGSARRLSNGHWLISWGGLGNIIAGYKPNGDRTFALQLAKNRTYRAEPVPDGAVSADDLRRGMNAMCAAGCS